MKSRPHIILGSNVSRLRREAGYKTAEEFAEKLGIGVSTVRNIERGTAEGRRETRELIAEKLGISVEELYVGPLGRAVREMTKPTQAEMSLLEAEKILALLNDGKKPKKRAVILFLLTLDEGYLDRANLKPQERQFALGLLKIS